MPSIRRPGKNGWPGPAAMLTPSPLRPGERWHGAIRNGLVTTRSGRHPDGCPPRRSERDRARQEARAHSTEPAAVARHGGESCGGRRAREGVKSHGISKSPGSVARYPGGRRPAPGAVPAVRPAGCRGPRRGGPGRQAGIAEPGRALPGEHVHLAGPEITDVHDDRLRRAWCPRRLAGMRPRRARGGRRRGGGKSTGHRRGGQARPGEARGTLQHGPPGRPQAPGAFRRGSGRLIRVMLRSHET